MAILYADGMDAYTSVTDPAFLSRWTISGTITVSTTAGRFGGGCTQTTIGAVFNTKTFTAASELWVSCAVAPTNSSNGNQLVFRYASAGAVTEDTVTYNPSTGLWRVLQGTSAGTLLGSGTYLIPTGTYAWVETRLKMSATVGAFELWVNGTQVFSVSNVNTVTTNSTILNMFFSGTNTYDFDDIIINNTTGTNAGRFGDSIIYTEVPVGDVTSNGVPLSGMSHFAMVDEPQNDGDTSYNTLVNVSGQAETYTFGAVPNSPTIWAVQVIGIMEQITAGAQSIASVVVSGGTTSTGSSTAITTAYASYHTLLETDPNTSAQWTVSAVNAISAAGFKVP